MAFGLIEYGMKAVFKRRPRVIGVPTTLVSARDLARHDKLQLDGVIRLFC